LEWVDRRRGVGRNGMAAVALQADPVELVHLGGQGVEEEVGERGDAGRPV
jgi:hypothetical protein